MDPVSIIRPVGKEFPVSFNSLYIVEPGESYLNELCNPFTRNGPFKTLHA